MNCEECTLDGVQVPMQVPVDPQMNVLFVGQAPGRTELVTKVPFTGDAGKMLYALLRGAGIDKRRIYITNLVSCKPPVDAKGNDKEPTLREILNCHSRLVHEIHDIKPSLIVAIGGPAAYTLTGRDGISKLRGEFFPLKSEFEYSCPVLCTLHPAYVMRQRQWIDIAIKDLQLVNHFLIHGIAAKTQPDFVLDPSYEELKEYLYKEKLTAFDTETTGLKVRSDSVIGASFSNSVDTACAVYFKPHDPRIDLIIRWLMDEKYEKCTQNGSFDCEILYNNLGVYVRGLRYDTRLAEQLLHSDLPTNLDHLRATYTKIEPYKPEKKEMKLLHTWGKEKMLTYAAWDAITTYQVMVAQKRILTEGQLKLLEEHLIPLTFILNKMERKGVLVDIDELAGAYARQLPKCQEAEKLVLDKLQIDPHSPKQVSTYFNLKDAKRETFEYYIQRGDPRASDMELVMRARDLRKETSTYLRGLYDRLEDRYIHTEYKLDGTGTGRLSSSNPNLQNIPKYLRGLYIAEPERTLVSGDYKQLELWVGATIAPCEALLTDLKSGVDVHSEIAKLIEPYTNKRLHDRLRLTAKTVVFGTFYGRSARSIAIQFGVSIQEAEQWQEICFAKYPGLQKYVRERLLDFNTTRKVTTPWGRVRHVLQPTQAFNTPVQSSASDVTLSTMIELDREGFDLRLNVHDEIVFQCKDEELDASIERAKEIFERPIEVLNSTCFPTEFKYGKSWGDMTKV
jgi:DNA polymerase I